MRRLIKFFSFLGLITASVLGVSVSTAQAAIVTNTVTGNINGIPLDLTNATVNLDVIASQVVTSVVGEISPNIVAQNDIARAFSYDIRLTTGVGDSGVDLVNITAPASYNNLAITAVTVDSVPPAVNCPTPGIGQYCASIAGQTMSFILGNVVNTDQSNIHVEFTADTPGVTGSASFTTTVDNAAIVAVSIVAVPEGNADGDGADNNSQQVTVIGPVDPNLSSVIASPNIVIADGVAFTTVTVTLRDPLNNPVAGKTVSIATDRGVFDTITQPVGPTGADGAAVGMISSSTLGVSTITVTDVTDGYALTAQPVVYFTQGEILELTKRANKLDAQIGDVVTYTIDVMNNDTANDVLQVTLKDQLPPNFKYRAGSLRMNGAPVVDPVGVRELGFNLGAVSALIDNNANGRADPGETGHISLSYQLIVGAGAQPGDYNNTAFAIDACDQCRISNRVEAKVTVTLDLLFDLGTIIGKVFNDKNSDGIQDSGEPGIGSAKVVLDNGSYVLTDEYGRYHFPAVAPGQRMLKIDVQNLPSGMSSTVDDSKVVDVTPGLLAKANFSVDYLYDIETIGRPAVKGVMLSGLNQAEHVKVMGSAETMMVVINGRIVKLPQAIIEMGDQQLEDKIEIRGGQLNKPAVFRMALNMPQQIKRWTMSILTDDGSPVRVMQGVDYLPELTEWDGLDDNGQLVEGGKLFTYQVLVEYKDGSRVTSARRMFGVNRTEVLAVNMTGGTFIAGSSILTAAARIILSEAAGVLRQFPDEQVVIEGHSDSVGQAAMNMKLSESRAKAAASYLIEEENIPQEQLVVKGFGEDQPLASNDYKEGRELNRRIEVKGNFSQHADAKLFDQYRSEATLVINGESLPVDKTGRFTHVYEGSEVDKFEISMNTRQGRSVQTTLNLPRLDITSLSGDMRLVYGTSGDNYRVRKAPGLPGWDDNDEVVNYRLDGITEPGSRLEIDGKEVPVNKDGRFSHEMSLHIGNNHSSAMIQNQDGYLRFADIGLTLRNRDENGDELLVVEPIPHMTVELPPRDLLYQGNSLPISGVTDPANRVQIDGEYVDIQSDGRFTTAHKLPKDLNHVVIKVTNPQGFSGTVERDVETGNHKMFLLAFADGKIGMLKGSGYLEGAGMKEDSEFYAEGRVAYYLKGMVKGKYLITSSFDSGAGELEDLFKNLDDKDTSKLLTNLDPDKLYPVYGDDSSLIHDNESQGKFYLSVKGEDLEAVVGNYAISLNDTELSRYQRTLYGVFADYHSVARSKYGKHDTQIVVFGAQVSQVPVHDELRATGGSLYYLSHSDIIEGSEQITLLVRDKDTGLTLGRTTLQQNLDYRIYYDQGRLLFNAPIASMARDQLLINSTLLAGNPVSIEVDYEARQDAFEKNAYGGRVRKQLGDHLAVGATYISDDLDQDQYELSGVDAEMRLGRALRLLAEVATSTGNNGRNYLSNDGGLSFSEITPGGSQSGDALKVTAELDVGELLGKPGKMFIDMYYKKLGLGFVSSGNLQDEGVLHMGVNVNFALTDKDKLLGRYAIEESEKADPSDPAAIAKTSHALLQWRHDEQRWGISAEYKHEEQLNAMDSEIASNTLLAGQLRYKVNDKLKASLKHQKSLSGVENSLTTLGADYLVNQYLNANASASTGSQGDSAEAGISWLFGDNRMYLTDRIAQQNTGKSSQSIIIGGESQVDPATRVYSEYQFERGTEGDKQISLTGVNRFWDLKKGMRLQVAAEQSEASGAGTNSKRDTFSGNLSYKNMDGLRWSTKNERRSETGSSKTLQYLTSNLFEMKLSPAYTLLAKYNMSETQDQLLGTTTAEFDEHSVGMAYRPTTHDRLNLLARYTGISDKRPNTTLGFAETEQTKMEVFSIEWSYLLSNELEWVSKEALRNKTEETGGFDPLTSTTWLSIQRLNYQFATSWDIGLEYRTLAQQEADDKRNGWLSEVMWRANKHMRLGVGYNFTDFSDNEFSDNDYSVHGLFLRIQGKH